MSIQNLRLGVSAPRRQDRNIRKRVSIVGQPRTEQWLVYRIRIIVEDSLEGLAEVEADLFTI